MADIRWKRLLPRSKERMVRLVQLDAPDVIIANEARILLRGYHGGNIGYGENCAVKLQTYGSPCGCCGGARGAISPMRKHAT
jgi:hypothetical protein